MGLLLLSFREAEVQHPSCSDILLLTVNLNLAHIYVSEDVNVIITLNKMSEQVLSVVADKGEKMPESLDQLFSSY